MPKFEIPKKRLVRLPAMRVKFKDIFDLKLFYEAMHEWLVENEWIDDEEGLDHWEAYYSEKIDRNGAKELFIRWRMFKKPAGGPGFAYYLDFDWHCIAITSTEIVKEGRKLKVNKGEVEIYIRPYLERVYEKDFSENWFLRQFQNIFTGRIYRSKIEQRKKELYQEGYACQNFMKQWFKLKRYLPYEESKSFFPSRAWPSHQKQE